MHLRGGNRAQGRLNKCKEGKDKSIQDDDMEVEDDKNRVYSGVLYIFRRDEAFQRRKFYLDQTKKSFNFTSKTCWLDDFTC